MLAYVDCVVGLGYPRSVLVEIARLQLASLALPFMGIG
jgi:hypothetical protein